MRYDNWDVAGFDRDKAASLYENNINPLVAVTLASRAVTSLEDVKAFLNTDEIPFNDPLTMADIDKAVARIRKAIDDNETIAIYGDYDVDGMTSTALFALWLKSKGANYEMYIPGRFDEGYSLNANALDILKQRGATLVVTVDCGIVAIEEAQHAAQIGLDLIITDHHECKDKQLPEAVAVIDPKRPDCPYAFKSLAGVGVALKLICALEDNNIPDEVMKDYLQLAALGTVADVMPVLGENRKIVACGLRAMNNAPLPAVRQLLRAACPDDSAVTSSTIGYVLAPRLNAAGRLGDPLLSVKLLLCSNDAQAEKYVTLLCELNGMRRELEQEIFDNAVAMLGDDIQTGPVVLASTQWNQGVTGIVASRIQDKFKLPAIIISINEDGIGRGSCRSDGSFSIYDALQSCEDILIGFGGHDRAAGLDITEGNIPQLRTRIAEFYKNHTKDRASGTTISLDFEVDKPDKLLTVKNIEALSSLEPFGSGFPAPRLYIHAAVLTSVIPIAAGKHTKLKIEKAGTVFDCIMFSVSSEALGVKPGDVVDIAFEPQINDYRDRRTVQLNLSDIRLTSIT